jgi:hypothetical protein
LEENKSKFWTTSRLVVLVVVLVGGSASGVVAASYVLPSLELCVGTFGTVHFTIVMSSDGFNGSKNVYPNVAPVLNVGRCQTVVVHLVNQDTVDTHGFAIAHYFDSGTRLSPGTSQDVTFTANRAGRFTVYCNVLCPIHLYMQNGRLNVT